MKIGKLSPQARVWTVKADLPISECVRVLRDHDVGALVVLSDDFREEIVGIFTERDLVKNIELIQRGGFWESPVRTVMSPNVRTITVDELSEAPRLMARYHIRHLPVVSEEKGRKRLVGVISMRDVFRVALEEVDFDLAKLYRQLDKPKKPAKKLLGVFSADPQIQGLIDQGSKLTRHLLVKAAKLSAELENLSEVLERFDALFLDLDDLNSLELEKVLAAARASGREEILFLAFSPAKLNPVSREALRKVSARKRVHLLAKPVALGLLYEKFLREA